MGRRGAARLVVGVLCSAMPSACSDDDDADSSAGEGAQTSDGGPTGEGGPTEAGSAEGGPAEGGSAEGGTTTSGTTSDGGQTGGPDCNTVSEGEPCSTPGAECTYGDDCGSSDYRCDDGVWVQIGGSDCGALPVPCADGPSDGDICEGQEVCDPDGDCLDVLECIGSYWTPFAICSADFCAAAMPSEGAPCDELDRMCPSPCVVGQPTFVCSTEGWSMFGGMCAR